MVTVSSLSSSLGRDPYIGTRRDLTTFFLARVANKKLTPDQVNQHLNVEHVLCDQERK